MYFVWYKTTLGVVLVAESSPCSQLVPKVIYEESISFGGDRYCTIWGSEKGKFLLEITYYLFSGFRLKIASWRGVKKHNRALVFPC